MRRKCAVVAFVAAFLWTGAVPAAPQGKDKEAGHVYFLLAIDTVTPDYQALGLDLDRDHMVRLIRSCAKTLGYAEGPKGRYTIKVLEGQDMSEKAVLDYFRTLPATPRDTLVFYYTGHGGFYPDKGHLFAMRNYYDLKGPQKLVKRAVVDRKELLAAMDRHHPRGLIVLTDCCASTNLPLIAGGSKLTPPSSDFMEKLKGEGEAEVFRDLFFRATGVVNVTAARTGSPARGRREKNGSHFTVALWKLLQEGRELFDEDGNGVVDWKEFYPALTTLTELESLEYRPQRNGKKMADFHTPEAFALGEKVRAGGSTVKGKAPILAVDEELTAEDKVLMKRDKTFYMKEYRVPMKAGQAYLVSLHSSHFDTFLFLKDESGKALAVNDDYGNTTTRSRILFHPPEDGTYVVGVTSFGATETGRFSLTVHPSTLRGDLTANTPRDRFCMGAHSKVHPIHLTALRSYTIQLESDDFDTYLRVEDEYGNTIALNDDEDESQGRLNSLITLRTFSTGTYYIVATSFQEGRTGRYAVFVQE